MTIISMKRVKTNNTSYAKIVVVDSDALIALFNKDDTNIKQAESFLEKLYDEKARLIYPATTLVETVDTLQRKLKKHTEAVQIVKFIGNAQFATESIEAVSGIYLKEAVKFFEQRTSHRNTLADSIVAAIAKKHNADAIFSFDGWYKKLGFKLVADLY